MHLPVERSTEVHQRWESTGLESMEARRHLGKRALNSDQLPFIIVGVVVLVAVLITVALMLRRRSRLKKYKQASGDDTSSEHRRSHQLSETSRNNASTTTANTTNTTTAEQPASGNRNETTVDRHTSVRSIMTLPAYRPMASHNEQVLGREGDRDGIDVVVDLPTAEEEETRRDDEMEALYQIRQARRNQQAEREQRRRDRQEAQASNDYVALAQIRANARRAHESNTAQIDELRGNVRNLQDGSRNRSVSSVSYNQLGVARHDGSRLRAGSNDSERMGLLSDAASITMSTRSGAVSPHLHQGNFGHHRNQSVSSMASGDSDFPSPQLTRTRTDSQAGAAGGAGSSPELVEREDAQNDAPPPEYVDVSLEDDAENERGRSRAETPVYNEPPPDYPGSGQRDSATSNGREEQQEDAESPRSSTPTQERPPQLPALMIDSLPEIRIEPSSAVPRSARSEDPEHSDRE